MHHLLHHLSFATLHTVVGDEVKSKELISDIGLLPKKDDVPPKCPRCGFIMKSNFSKNHITGFRWICVNRDKRKCFGYINPAGNTFMFNTKITIQDILFIIIFFTWKLPAMDCLQHLNAWRKYRAQSTVSYETIYDWYDYCQEVVEIHASHNSQMLGGAGKSVIIFKTYLTRRKGTHFKIDLSQVASVFGIYCKEDKEGLYFLSNKKSKKELRLLIEKHCHPNSKVTYNDDAALKNLVNQHTVLRFYRRIRLKNLSLGEKVQQFLEDIAAVFPGYKNGVKKEGLRLIQIDDLVKSEDNPQLIPEAEKPAVEPIKLVAVSSGCKNGVTNEDLRMIQLDDSVKSESNQQLVSDSEEPTSDNINLLDSHEISFIEESIVFDTEVMMEME